MGSCLSGEDESAAHMTKLRTLYGIEIRNKKDPQRGVVDLCDLERLFDTCNMRIHPRAGFDPDTQANDFARLSRSCGMDELDLVEASEMYTSLIKEYSFTGPNLVVHMMRWAGIEPHLVRFLCSTLAADELLSFSVIMHLIAIFHCGRPAEKLAFIFSLCDTDGSGALSPTEVEHVLKVTAGDFLPDERVQVMVEQLFSRIDKNADGQLQFDEFIEHYPFVCKLLNLDSQEEEDVKESSQEKAKEDKAAKVRGVLAAWRSRNTLPSAQQKSEGDHARAVLAVFQARIRGSPAPERSRVSAAQSTCSSAGPPSPLGGSARSHGHTGAGLLAPPSMHTESPESTTPTLQVSDNPTLLAPSSPKKPMLRRLRSMRQTSTDDMQSSPVGSAGPGEVEPGTGKKRPVAPFRGRLAPPKLVVATTNVESRGGPMTPVSARSDSRSTMSTSQGTRRGLSFASIRSFFRRDRSEDNMSETSSAAGSVGVTRASPAARRYSDDDFVEAAYEVQHDLRREWMESSVRHNLSGLGGACILAVNVVYQATRVRAQLEKLDGDDDFAAFNMPVPSSPRETDEGLGVRTLTTSTLSTDSDEPRPLTPSSGGRPSRSPRNYSRRSTRNSQRMRSGSNTSGREFSMRSRRSRVHSAASGCSASSSCRSPRSCSRSPSSAEDLFMADSHGHETTPPQRPVFCGKISPRIRASQQHLPFPAAATAVTQSGSTESGPGLSPRPCNQQEPAAPTDASTPPEDAIALWKPAAAAFALPGRGTGPRRPGSEGDQGHSVVDSQSTNRPRRHSVRLSLHSGRVVIPGETVAESSLELSTSAAAAAAPPPKMPSASSLSSSRRTPGGAAGVPTSAPPTARQGSSTTNPAGPHIPAPAAAFEGDRGLKRQPSAELLSGLESLQKEQLKLQKNQERIQLQQQQILRMHKESLEMLKHLPAGREGFVSDAAGPRLSNSGGSGRPDQ